METPIEEPKRSGKRFKRDKKVGQTARHTKGTFRPEISITKKQFEITLERVFTTPVSGKPQAGDLKVNGTSKHRLSDDYSGKRKSQDKTGDKEG